VDDLAGITILPSSAVTPNDVAVPKTTRIPWMNMRILLLVSYFLMQYQVGKRLIVSTKFLQAFVPLVRRVSFEGSKISENSRYAQTVDAIETHEPKGDFKE